MLKRGMFVTLLQPNSYNKIQSRRMKLAAACDTLRPTPLPLSLSLFLQLLLCLAARTYTHTYACTQLSPVCRLLLPPPLRSGRPRGSNLRPVGGPPGSGESFLAGSSEFGSLVQFEQHYASRCSSSALGTAVEFWDAAARWSFIFTTEFSNRGLPRGDDIKTGTLTGKP